MSDDLAQYLDSLQREGRYRVVKVLKESAYETTQRVVLVNEDGSASGPFIRKYIKRDMGLGVAYERIFAAQQKGKAFDHLPCVHECYVHDDEMVVVMELVEGETLKDLVYRLDSSVELAREVFPKLCDAARELHEGFNPPLIHRDLKPSNVIVSNVGSSGDLAVDLCSCKVTIIDFGIAREIRDGAEADTAHFGTRDFAPPEQFGYGQTTASSDVYALGMLLYFCLTETIPTAAVREAGFDDPRVPEALRRLIVQATSFDPAQRFNSARALKAAFENAVMGIVSGSALDVDAGSSSSAAWRAPSETALASAPGIASPGMPGTAPAGSQRAAHTEARAGVPPIVARVWNFIVTAFGLFMFGYTTYLLVTGSLMSPDRIPYSPVGSVVSYLLGILLTVLLCFACFDKRDLRMRFPALRQVKAWHCWAFVVLAYAIATTVRGVIT